MKVDEEQQTIQQDPQENLLENLRLKPFEEKAR